MEDTATREGASAGSRSLALIAAGGEGRRLGSDGPKALVRCAGRPLLAWCLDAFAQSATFGDAAGAVVVAAHGSDLPAFEAACSDARTAGLDVAVVAGGPSRSHSVAAALRAGGEADLVLVHDAARIFTTSALIDALHDALSAEAAEIAGLIAARRVTDTIKLVGEAGEVERTPPRERLWAVQTPQAFRYAPLAAALGLSGDVDDAGLASASDDASLVEAGGGRVKVYEWPQPNGKITTPEDLSAAERRLRQAGG